jgi:hypothetical protein
MRRKVRRGSGMSRLPPLDPARASSLRRARATSISGRFGVRRRDGCTRGGSPGCLRYCGGHAASPSPSRSCCADSSSNASSEPAAASMPSWRSPSSANRCCIVTRVKSRGSQSVTSSQCSGAETRASSVGRTEYAAATVRSFAFWL